VRRHAMARQICHAYQRLLLGNDGRRCRCELSSDRADSEGGSGVRL
jgi:hypothetical protein